MDIINNYTATYIDRSSNINRKKSVNITGFGKIDNLSNNLYNDYYKFIYNNLQINEDEKFFLIGMSESGVLLSNWIYNLLPYKNKKYIYTTRKKLLNNKILITFLESHCANKNTHYFTIDFQKYLDYKTLIIIEDEITTGNTIINLINSIKNHFINIYIYTLVDSRISENIVNIFDINIKLYSFNIKINELKNSNSQYNELINYYKENIFFIIGECSEYCIEHYKKNGNILKIIPSTKYKVDNINIFNMIDLTDNCNHYYIYNIFKINYLSKIYIYFFTNEYNIFKNLYNYIKNYNVNIHINEILTTNITNNNILKIDFNKNDCEYNNYNEQNYKKTLHNIISYKDYLYRLFNDLSNKIINISLNDEIIILSNIDNIHFSYLIHKLLERKLGIHVEFIFIEDYNNIENIKSLLEIFSDYDNNIWLINNNNNNNLNKPIINNVFNINILNNIININNNEIIILDFYPLLYEFQLFNFLEEYIFDNDILLTTKKYNKYSIKKEWNNIINLF